MLSVPRQDFTTLCNGNGVELFAVRIPSEIDGFKVTAVGPDWGVWKWNSHNEPGDTIRGYGLAVVLPSGLDSIVGAPFCGYNGLGEVWVPKSVRVVTECSFDSCNHVTIEKGSPLKEEFDHSIENKIWGIDKSKITFE